MSQSLYETWQSSLGNFFDFEKYLDKKVKVYKLDNHSSC